MKVINKLPITGLLGRTSHKLRLVLDKKFHSNNIDINVEQFIVLRLLSKNNGANQQQISNIIDRDKTTITRLISRMEAKNLLLRVPCKEDKRVKNVYITNYGKQVLLSIQPLTIGVQKELEGSVSEDQLDVFYSVMDKFLEVIQSMEK
jgi:DNA-binding MarR family transcriptional regulator